VGTPHVSGVRPSGIVHSLSNRHRPTPPERRRHWRDGLRRGARFAADHPPQVPAGRLQRLLDQATVAVGEPRISLCNLLRAAYWAAKASKTRARRPVHHATSAAAPANRWSQLRSPRW
jgi:hypothetical protein